MSISFRRIGLAGLAILLLTTACGGDDDEKTDDTGSSSGSSTQDTPSGKLRLGYFPNLTHAPAIVGIQEKLFEEALGGQVDVEYVPFNAGGEAVEALFADSIDASFIGPNPAINGFAQSDGEALRIVAGATSGGAALVVQEDIDSPGDLKGKTLATPALGNTQDVALRAWLKDEGLTSDTAGGGDVKIVNSENADTLTAFQEGDVAGAWLPEPWATRLQLEGGAKVLVDEADLWENGEFVTTQLIVASKYLEEQPANVRALIEGLLDSLERIESGDPAEIQTVVNDGIETATTKRLKDETMTAAWENLTFTHDPIASSLSESKDDAVAAGVLDAVDLEGIYDLTILNEVLAERGEPEVEGL
jgi:NitT/TauT family transport system substrate-binding protein